MKLIPCVQVYWYSSEAATGRVSKKESLEILKNSQEKQTPAHVFSCEFCKIFSKTYFVVHLWTAASNSFSTIKYDL